MKKILILLAAAAVSLFSCTKFENDTADSPLAVPSIDVTIDSKSDSTFTFTVKPGTGTGYYSYTVLKGAAKYLDSTKVLGVSCKGITEATQTMEAKPTVTVKLGAKDGILPNTTYTVYAVAANAQSLVSTVKSATVLTSDNNTPTPKGAVKSKTAAAATVSFNESVVRGGGKVFAHYYKVWDPEKEAMTLELAKKDIVISGTDVTLSAPDTVNGAYVLFTWEEGMVKNAVGTKCPEYKSNRFYAKNGKVVADSCKGIVTRWPVGTFGWTRVCEDTVTHKVVPCPEDSVLAFVNPADAAYLIKADSTIVSSSSDLSVSVAYFNSNSATVFKETEKVKLDEVNNVVALGTKKGSDPEYGDYVVWGVPAGLFIDVWGNTCEAYTNADNYLRSLGLTEEDFCGTFAIKQYLINGGKGYYCNDTITITKSKKKGVVDVSGFGKGYYGKYSSLTFTPVSYPCTCDFDLGFLNFPLDKEIGSLKSTTEDYGKIYMGWNPTDDVWTPAYFSMKEAGKYTFESAYPYLEYANIKDGKYVGKGYVVLMDITEVKAAPTAISQPAPQFFPLTDVPKKKGANTNPFKF